MLARMTPADGAAVVREHGIVKLTDDGQLRGERRRTRTTLWTTVYELDSPAAVETKEFTAMRGWGPFAPRVRSQTRVVTALR